MSTNRPTTRATRRTVARRSRAGEGPEARARRVPGDGKAHQQRHGRRGATTGRRDDEQRRRAEGCANGPAGRGRRPGEEGNRAREGRRCSSRKESRSSSPETANRRRPTELLAAASMAAGRRRLDSGRENAGASSRRLEEVEGEVRGPWTREIEERRPRLVGAPAVGRLCSARARGRKGGEGGHGSCR